MENQKNMRYPLSSIENFYKYSSTEYPKSSIEEIELDSPNSTRFETKSKSDGKIKKKVEFNKNVTVVNIQSYKKEMKKNSHKNYPSFFDEDFNDEMKCINCNIF